MDERVKNALIESARAQQALVAENDALKEENAALRAKLHDYEKKSKAAAAKAASSSSSSSLPVSTGQVGSLNLSCLEKKRKQPVAKKKPATVSSSSLASSWGGGGGAAFMDLDEPDEDKEQEKQQEHEQEREREREREEKPPEAVPVQPRVGRPPQPKKQKQKHSESAAKVDVPSPPPPPQPRPLEQKEPKERGWKGVNHILQAAAATATPALVPAHEGLVLTSRTVQQVLFELSCDNVLSAAVALSRHDPALLALCLQQAVAAMVAASEEGSLVSAFSPRLASFLDAASRASTARSCPQGPVLTALFSKQLVVKLCLLPALLTAMATRTSAGPEYVDTVLRLLRLRCVASVRHDRASPLCMVLLGRACGAAAEAKKREDHADNDGEAEEGDVDAILKAVNTLPPAKEAHTVTSTDLDFSDSDSDGDDGGKGDETKESALLPAPTPSDRLDLLSPDEAARAGLSLVMAASSLYSGLAGHCNLLARDLAFVAANSPSLVCPGQLLGLLCALSSCDAPSVSSAFLRHVAYLGAELPSPAGDDNSDHGRWRRALVSAIKEECARLGGAAEAPAGLSEVLSLREQGTLGALCCGEPVGALSHSVSEALGLMGIYEVAEHADALRAVLQSCTCAAAGPEEAPQFSCREALSSHPPVRLAVAPADATAAVRLAEGLVTASYRRHWQGVLEGGSSTAGRAAGLERALCAVRAAGCYFDAMVQSDCDHLQGGWRGGPAGQGYSLQRRLKVRLAHARSVLHEYSALALGEAAPNVRSDPLDDARLSLQTDQGVALQLFAFTSVPLEKLLDAAAFLDYAVDVMRCGAEDEGEGGGGAAVEQASASLKKCMLELAAIVCCAVLERAQFLAHCSAVGGLGAALEAAESAPPSPPLGALLQGLASFLQAQPSFWAHPGRADVTCLMLRAAAQARRHEGQGRRVCLASETALAAFVSSQSRRLPAFVINLDRRLDRWRSILLTSDTHGLSAMRVSAVDGSLLSAGSDGDALSIPEADVVRRWDSTLNAAFDSFCQANTATPMTNSERGCAASHLKTWRAIAALRSSSSTTLSSSRGSSGGSSSSKQPRPASVGPQRELEGVDLRTMRDCLALTSSPTSSRDARSKDAFYLILEDDAAINAEKAAKGGGFRVTLARLLRRLPADCDICYLGWAIPWGKADHPKLGDFVKPSYIWQLHAYLVRGRAVDLLLASLPINAPLDNFVARLVFEKRLVAYALSEQLVQQVGSYAQRQGESDIHHSGRAVQLGR